MIGGGGLEDYDLFVGIDWGNESSAVCVVDLAGRIVGQRSVVHSGAEIGEFMRWLSGLGTDPERVAVGIETPRGALVEGLLQRCYQVYALNPKQLDRFRDRYSVAGAKDDRRDAYVLGDSLRTDRGCFRRLAVEDPLIIELRELTRVDEDLRQELNRLGNRLREQLQRYFPQWLVLAPTPDEPWVWDLLELAPTPQRAARLTAKRVSQVLRQRRIRRLSADQVLEQLRATPLTVAEGTTQAAVTHIGLLLPRLRLVRAQRGECARRIGRLLEQLGHGGDDEAERGEHRDVHILRSFHGAGRVVTATMLAEASQPLAQRDYHALRALGGIAPITRQSGRRKVVMMRYSCNGRLRHALYHWARVSVQHEPCSRARYAAFRARGHSHGRALRGVADRLLRVLVAALRDGRPYDPALARQPVGSRTEAAA